MSVYGFDWELIFWELKAEWVNVMFRNIFHTSDTLSFELDSFLSILCTFFWSTIQKYLSVIPEKCSTIIFSRSKWRVKEHKKPPKMKFILFEGLHTPSFMEPEVGQEIFEGFDKVHKYPQYMQSRDMRKKNPLYADFFKILNQSLFVWGRTQLPWACLHLWVELIFQSLL